ncbi:hypothetical protein CY0110_16072 [Crocosphaera chwakensis CCY0110]|uniref:Uncharacterized protein n=1 Tax=Crocosphaera chwakensis CCY0110 TaxID=391612 RepID=A3IHP6_9CHRO|nr:hypothetical protein CY0110_16072 [Crocosphaera chwakensis CCY0110]
MLLSYLYLSIKDTIVIPCSVP